MKAKNTAEAWKMVDELFPTDYIEDTEATIRAGYTIYRSTLDGCTDWISDLGDRLEVNTGGKSVNVWIEEETPESVCGYKVAPIYTPSVAVVVAVAISGGVHAQNAAEQRAYEALMADDKGAAFAALEQYAATAGIKWGTMRLERVTHYPHPDGSGHFVVQGIIEPPCEDSLGFLPFCADLLAEIYKENNR